MGKLTIQEIAAVLIEKNGLGKPEANRFASAMFALIQERLESDHLVKVKGLGTFKIVDVEARESVNVSTGERITISSHSKVTFTPDATMKELVNKPFSQFETVVLNDGVEFDDIEEEQAEVEQSIEEQAEVAESVAIMATPVAEESIQQQPKAEAEQEAEAEGEQEAEADTETEPEPEPETEPGPEPETETVDDTLLEGFADEEEGRPWGRWLLSALGVLLLMALSAFGGYYYGSQKQARMAVAPDTIIIRDTVMVAQQVDSTNMAVAETPEAAEKSTEVVEKSEVGEKPAEVVEKPKEQPKEQPKPVEPAVDKYAEKDARVRLGAYRIVGLDQEVKVQAGQTFRSVCKAYLGPDMECYVEVFNDLPKNPTVKAGQVIKIPKLQLKKKRQQTTRK
jgi:nucleoid DNA-binding protein